MVLCILFEVIKKYLSQYKQNQNDTINNNNGDNNKKTKMMMVIQ